MTNDDQSATEARPDEDEATGDPSDADASPPDESLTRALAAIVSQLGEARGQLDRLLTIQVDRMKLRLRSGMFWVLAGALLLATGATAAAVGVVYVIAGAAGAFGELFGGRVWAGQLAAGGLVLLAIALVFGIVRGARRKSELRKLMQKYESGKEGR